MAEDQRPVRWIARRGPEGQPEVSIKRGNLALAGLVDLVDPIDSMLHRVRCEDRRGAVRPTRDVQTGAVALDRSHALDVIEASSHTEVNGADGRV